MDSLNPVEWVSWLYGKYFQQHPFAGGAIVITFFAGLGLILWIRGVDKFKDEHKEHAASPPALSAAGGNAKVTGNSSFAMGGPGGKSGLVSGGRGGDAEVKGDNSIAVGGEGGEAKQADGRGGKGGKSGAEVLGDKLGGMPDYLRGWGHGGSGASTPEYLQKVKIVEGLREEYIKGYPNTPASAWESKDSVPIGWINGKLKKMGVAWRVEVKNNEYTFSPTPQ